MYIYLTLFILFNMNLSLYLRLFYLLLVCDFSSGSWHHIRDWIYATNATSTSEPIFEGTTPLSTIFKDPPKTNKVFHDDTNGITTPLSTTPTEPTISSFDLLESAEEIITTPKLTQIEWNDEKKGWKCRSRENLTLPCPEDEIEWLRNI